MLLRFFRSVELFNGYVLLLAFPRRTGRREEHALPSAKSVRNKKTGVDKHERVERKHIKKSKAHATCGGVFYPLALAFLLTLCLVPATLAASNVAYATQYAILVDGQQVNFDAYALKDANGNDTNYVKLRDIAYVLNGTQSQFSVTWNGAIQVVTGQSYFPDGSEMSAPFSGNQYYQNGTAPMTINGTNSFLSSIILTDSNGGGYTYYKLADLGSALGFDVSWNQNRGCIEIQTVQTPTVIPVTAVVVSGASSVEVGETISLSVTVSPSNATDRTFNISSSNSAVATVNANGAVTGISAGTAVITATASNGVSGQWTVTVTAPYIPALATYPNGVPTYTAVTGRTLKDTYSNGSGTVYIYSYDRSEFLSYFKYLLNDGWDVYDSKTDYAEYSLAYYLVKGGIMIGLVYEAMYTEVWVITD